MNTAQQQNMYLEFLSLAAKLKTTVRHSWPLGKNERRESVGDHSWRLVLMSLLYADKLSQPVDPLKCVLMASIHDLPEALCGDIPIINQDKNVKKQKDILEHQALIKMTESLDEDIKNKLRNAYDEYEAQQTVESKYVKALDKIEAFQQHNLDPLDTWEQKEKEMLFQDRYLMKHCQFDPFLKQLAQKVIDDGIQKLKDAGEDVEKIKEEAIQKDKLIDF
ncbi:hydrolase (HAD superfamily) (macronuclear) [Tetrahymena thermophila SB210]|uniref:Hydrolase (HAD superfamily) n=1 Tax=Tetrahymena thermophila (strain SB210) TaxID=312017 RepID=I7MB71_TETTS|nr:hydrolase (HAD superfamily) [Tetrahymena thermophila SB210]EAS07776.1 hydrolase (HAD superfamily) [Tetrahymena thermophila SB210]|eukprot:XP_001028018.1 hydrolase (HAD superfamily) [Tetrahymena thermophila SB210]